MMPMNNTPLYRTHWGMPSQPTNNYKAPSKKVVSIPVHFVGSHSDSDSLERRRNNSAVKIQKVVRAFLVRNTMRKIKAIRVEVEQIETRIAAPETRELMKRDQKERVRVSETIMNLLLRLDSVRVLSYYSGVRDCRRSVIKKAIALQEMVDQMVVGPTDQDQLQLTQAEAEDADANEDGSVGDSEEEEEMKVEEKEGEEMVDQTVGPTDQDVSSQGEEPHHGDADAEGSGSIGAFEGKKMEGLENEEVKMEAEEEENEDGEGVDPTDQDQTQVVSNQEGAHHEGEGAGAEDSAASFDDAFSDMFEADFEGKKMEGLRDEEEKMEVEEKQEEDGEESVGTSLVEEVEENSLVKEKEEGCEEEHEDCKDMRGEEGDHGKNNSRKLLKKMMDDNERMMSMMAQLFERNEMQTRLLSSLSHRVEQLERAFACEKLRRKKRRNADAKHKETESKNCCI